MARRPALRVARPVLQALRSDQPAVLGFELSLIRKGIRPDWPDEPITKRPVQLSIPAGVTTRTIDFDPVSRSQERIFVATFTITDLMRRIHRDTKERGRSIEEIKTRYEQDVIPAYEQHIAPFRQEADVVIANDYDDRDSIPLIVQMVLAYVDRLRMFGS